MNNTTFRPIAAQSGFTLLETLAAFAIGAIMIVGLVRAIDDSLEDSKGQQTSLYQAQVAEAAGKYIAANYTALLAQATAASPAKVDIAAIKAGNFLPTNFNPANPYGQTPCLLVLKPSAERLEALLVTEGGSAIPKKNLTSIAANAGQGGGYISSADATVAQGTFDAWRAPLAPYITKNCSGTATGVDHLASALFFDGPGNLSTDFLYRGAVPNHPELNQMTTPLHMRAIRAEDTSDPAGTADGCIAGDATTFGRIAVNASGVMLACENGVWRRYGSRFWKDPVLTFASLPATGNTIGDTRMVTDVSRAFTWNGVGWAALAVDQNGNMTVPGTLTSNKVTATDSVTTSKVTASTSVQTNFVQLDKVFVHQSACAPDGVLGREVSGLVMSCQGGFWRKLSEFAIGSRVFNKSYVKTSNPVNIIELIDLFTIGGSRPLYIDGDNYCEAWNKFQSIAKVEFYNNSMVSIGYVGGCIAESVDPPAQSRVGSGNHMNLTMIPENARYVRIQLHADGHANSMNTLKLNIYESF